MLPERSLLDVVDETDGRKVHVDLTLVLYHGGLGDIAGLRGAFDRALGGHGLRVVYGPRELRRAKDVGHEGVVVKAPDAMRTGGFECICQDELPHHLQVSFSVSENQGRVGEGPYGSITLRTMSRSVSPLVFPSLK